MVFSECGETVEDLVNVLCGLSDVRQRKDLQEAADVVLEDGSSQFGFAVHVRKSLQQSFHKSHVAFYYITRPHE